MSKRTAYLTFFIAAALMTLGCFWLLGEQVWAGVPPAPPQPDHAGVAPSIIPGGHPAAEGSQQPLTPGPDLIVEGISFDPPEPEPGQEVTVTLTIRNQGDADASGFYSYLYIDPEDEPPTLSTPDTSRSYIFGLNASKVYEWSFTNYTMTQGCHSVWGWVDRGDDVSEDEEGNNKTHVELCVGVDCEPDGYEEDDDCADATEISTNGSHQLHNLCPVGDVDWVAFQATAGMTYTIEASNVGADAEVILSLYDACGGAPSFGTGARIVWQAQESATYYVKVEHHDQTYGSETDYELSVTAAGGCDAYEPDDTCALARDIPVNGTRQTHRFCDEGDEDWIKFQAQSGASYLIVADNPGVDAEPILALHDTCDADPALGHGQQIRWTASSDGMFYLQVMNHDPTVYGPTTNYDLRVEQTGGCQEDGYENDDEAAQAKTIEVDGAAQRHNVCPAGDKDWVTFDAAAGTTYVLETSNLASAGDTVLCLYDTDGETQIQCNDDGGEGLGSRIRWLNTSSGTYYARVTHYNDNASGPDTAYDLTVGTQGCNPDAHEEDDDASTATVIGTDGSAQAHNYCGAGDHDWARFTVAAGVTYTIQTGELGAESDTMLTLYASDGSTQLAFNDDYAEGLDSRIDYVFPSAGTYYVKSEHYDDSRYGTGTEYQLSVEVDGDEACRELSDVIIAGPNSGETDTAHAFSASISPADATPPIAYTWSPEPESGQGTANATYRWETEGEYTISLSAGNCGGAVSDSHTIAVQDRQSEVRTLILVNRERLETLYGETPADQVMEKLEDLAQHDAVDGQIVQVETDTAVTAAYDDWTSDMMNTTKANDVTSAIRNLVMATLDNTPNVEYLVIVGHDEVIPFRRVLDRTRHPESNYEADASPGTAQRAACRDDMSLTDDYYADREPSHQGGHEIYIPDYSVGRLIERPEEMTDLIDDFLADPGVTADNVLVSGYDFIRTEAQRMADVWGTDLGSADVNSTLIGGGWSADELRDEQLDAAPRYDVQSINGHANHRVEGAPGWGTVSADEVESHGSADLSRALIYTLGCHSGFNDVGADGAGQNGLDLPQAFARRGAYYVANTGYGWGCRGSSCLSEVLMEKYTRNLSRGSSASIGKGLMEAKHSYYDEEEDFDGYDEKILIEATLYGLPMLELTTRGTLGPEDPFPSVVVTPTSPATFGPYVQGRLELSLPEALGAFDETSTGEGRYFALDGHAHANAGQPMQPQFFTDIPRQEGGTARGAILTGGSYQVEESFDPVIVQPMNEYYEPEEPTFSGTGWAPAVPFAVRRGGGSAASETLVASMGQYDGSEGAERLYESLSFDLTYSDSADEVAPTISSASARRRGLGVDVKVGVHDPSGVERVVVAYTDGDGVWSSLDLSYDAAAAKWTGRIMVDDEVEWFAQAVDGAGNVSLASEKGPYRVEAAPEMEIIYLPAIMRGH